MTTVEKRLLSASSDGQPVVVAATASTGTVIHTAVSGSTNLDEIWLWATNTDTVLRTLVLQWGNTSRLRSFPLDPNVETLIAPGWLLRNGLVVNAYSAGTANKIELIGHVHRITP